MTSSYFSIDIEKATLHNDNYRKVLYTTPGQQLVLMSVNPSEDIPLEVHNDVDQFIRVESGKGQIILNHTDIVELKDGVSVTIKRGTPHHVLNTGDVPLKLYSIYSPPEHPPTTLQNRQIKKRPSLWAILTLLL